MDLIDRAIHAWLSGESAGPFVEPRTDQCLQFDALCAREVTAAEGEHLCRCQRCASLRWRLVG